MAYIDQTRKAQLAPAIKAAAQKHGAKVTIAVRHHSTLVVTVQAGRLDPFADLAPSPNWNPELDVYRERARAERRDLDVNVYHYRRDFQGPTLAFLEDLIPACNAGNHDRSDLQTDYFDVGWYLDVTFGRWDRPYELVPSTR